MAKLNISLPDATAQALRESAEGNVSAEINRAVLQRLADKELRRIAAHEQQNPPKYSDADLLRIGMGMSL
ncbi:hypothetical protein IU414_17880 [Nocardia farcinica]|uniref:Uncharacterized protein n=1 Tax=Nocardia farcinica TaxID=37329 RepID=A0A0H5PQ70_NOCFR|nr:MULTISPECIES: hypothetical protein [Nocardia]AVH20128.1 hypothetical protein C5B73_00320 [Nocardia cyriacigeorgica]AXK90000.1 hypothetical protein DXT66_29875 [Nocardia farcinica]MBF6254000.1 hypothetical protein [Nocardia farcinica]MBF6265537.1 hypothetical protein [Nocardia farcinica]MBF6271292.1 hypothetical protein [Nocardia farcinica]